jgi:hypothetical protein
MSCTLNIIPNILNYRNRDNQAKAVSHSTVVIDDKNESWELQHLSPRYRVSENATDVNWQLDGISFSPLWPKWMEYRWLEYLKMGGMNHSGKHDCQGFANYMIHRPPFEIDMFAPGWNVGGPHSIDDVRNMKLDGGEVLVGIQGNEPSGLLGTFGPKQVRHYMIALKPPDLFISKFGRSGSIMITDVPACAKLFEFDSVRIATPRRSMVSWSKILSMTVDVALLAAISGIGKLQPPKVGFPPGRTNLICRTPWVPSGHDKFRYCGGTFAGGTDGLILYWTSIGLIFLFPIFCSLNDG